MIMADILQKGHKASIPIGEDWRYDIIVLRNNELVRVQCKYLESNGEVIRVRPMSKNDRGTYKYTKNDIDWLAVYDATDEKCYYIPAELLGDGKSQINLRITPTKNNQVRGVLWARDFMEF